MTDIDYWQYLAANPDLMRAGLTVTTAAQHYATWGAREGRATTFDQTAYLAANPDVLRAGFTTSNAARHYVANGFTEGRSTSFAAARYLAANTDLLRAGLSTADAAAHYVRYGVWEGRTTAFDGASYLASNTDVLRAGYTAANAAEHYAAHGFREGRSTSFDGTSYLAANPDAIEAGYTVANAAEHYLEFGIGQDRPTRFDAGAYLAANPDLLAAGIRTESGAIAHYLANGYREGRATSFDPTTFDAGSYLAGNPDVQTVADGLAAGGSRDRSDFAVDHYLNHGIFEGRAVGSSSGTSTSSTTITTNQSVTGSLSRTGERDDFSVYLRAGLTYTIDLKGRDSSGGTLADPYLRLYSGINTLLGSDDDTGAGLDSRLVHTATTTGMHRISAGAYGDRYTGSYTLSVTTAAQSQPRLWVADWRGAEDTTGSTVNDAAHNNARARDAEFRVFLSEPATQAVTFRASLGYNTTPASVIATADASDFGSFTNGQTYRIEAGQRGVTIRVPIAADYNAEQPERFTLTLSNVSGATATRTTATGIIIDNDATYDTIDNLVLHTDSINTGEFLTSYRGHAGTDLNAVGGSTAENAWSPIFGEVVRVDQTNQYFDGDNIGKIITVKLPEREQSASDRFYFVHATNPDVRVGQLIGLDSHVGVFGRTDLGPHVHIESRTNGSRSPSPSADSTNQDPRIPIALSESNRQVSPLIASGDVIFDAEPLGQISDGVREIYDMCGTGDRQDWYRFYLDDPTQLTMRLSINATDAARADLRLAVYDENGREVTSTLTGSTQNFVDGVQISDRWQRAVAPGVYHARVEYAAGWAGTAPASTDFLYRLRISNSNASANASLYVAGGTT